MTRTAALVLAFLVAASGAPAAAQAGGTKASMEMGGPAHFRPTRQAYTTNGRFLVRLLDLPRPIPFEKYFTLRFAVYDGHDRSKRLAGAELDVFAGMRHGLKHGFAHGMQSSPRIRKRNGAFVVSGMYFHMHGPWVVEVTVHRGGRRGVAYFRLPCCGT